LQAFEKMNQFITNIIKPQLHFEGVDQTEKLVKLFCDLYRIDLFKDGLDLILTKIKEKDMRLEVKIIKGWDTNVGCFSTEVKSFYDKTLGKFFHKQGLLITLRNLSHNLIAHEMGHALAYESGIKLGEDFRTAIGYDMKDREPNNLALKGAIKNTLAEGVKSYPQDQIIGELFVRYFELLSLSRDVSAFGAFTTAEVMDFFQNTTNFLAKIFNPKIRTKIDQEIARQTVEIAKQVKIAGPEHKFQEKVESFHKRSTSSWSKNVKSNAGWQVGWEKYQELEDKKNQGGDKK
jgi:hypothetical protein